MSGFEMIDGILTEPPKQSPTQNVPMTFLGLCGNWAANLLGLEATSLVFMLSEPGDIKPELYAR